MRILLAALLLTLLNLLKPAVVDDTAYLLFARHLSQHPLDPYGFELFWYDQPYPAMQILLPPVLPYWLALSIKLFGEDVNWQKLALYPFAWLLAWSVQQLWRRFAERVEPYWPLVLLSAYVLPLFSVMLDVPALALGLAAVACFLRAQSMQQLRWALLSAVLVALAIQTKYSMLTVPVVLVLATLLWGGWRYLVLVAFGSAMLFGGWEYLLWLKYDESHFWFHVQSQATGQWLERKLQLVTPLLKFLGLLAGGWGIWAGTAVGFPRWLSWLVGTLGLIGTAWVLFTPGQEAILLKAANGAVRYDLPMLVFGSLGIALLIFLGVATVRLLVRLPRFRPRLSRVTLFLLGWLLLELVGYFVLTPFPAGRRLMGLCFIISLLAARVAHLAPRRRHPGWPETTYLLITGLLLFALETWDARAERDLAQQAARIVKPAPGATVWTQGHWGWQYYIDRAGMKLARPGVLPFQAGDWLVLPIEPELPGFYRPYHSGANIKLEPDCVEFVQELVWDDWVQGQTIPNLHGGYSPIIGRDAPRLRVRIYRIHTGWLPRQP